MMKTGETVDVKLSEVARLLWIYTKYDTESARELADFIPMKTRHPRMAITLPSSKAEKRNNITPKGMIRQWSF